MNENGKKQNYLFETVEYRDATGLTIFNDKQLTLWANGGFIEQIKHLEGISCAFYGQIKKGRYDIFLDPRYDVEFIKRKIEAIITCIGE